MTDKYASSMVYQGLRAAASDRISGEQAPYWLNLFSAGLDEQLQAQRGTPGFRGLIKKLDRPWETRIWLGDSLGQTYNIHTFTVNIVGAWGSGFLALDRMRILQFMCTGLKKFCAILSDFSMRPKILGAHTLTLRGG